MGKNVLLVENLKNLSLIELVELTATLEKEFKIDSALSTLNLQNLENSKKATVVAENSQKNILYSVLLESVTPEKRISCIKVVRALTGFGLKECKEIVEAAPSTVKTQMEKEEAEKLHEELLTAGGVAKLVEVPEEANVTLPATIITIHYLRRIILLAKIILIGLTKIILCTLISIIGYTALEKMLHQSSYHHKDDNIDADEEKTYANANKAPKHWHMVFDKESHCYVGFYFGHDENADAHRLQYWNRYWDANENTYHYCSNFDKNCPNILFQKDCRGAHGLSTLPLEEPEWYTRENIHEFWDTDEENMQENETLDKNMQENGNTEKENMQENEALDKNINAHLLAPRDNLIENQSNGGTCTSLDELLKEQRNAAFKTYFNEQFNLFLDEQFNLLLDEHFNASFDEPLDDLLEEESNDSSKPLKNVLNKARCSKNKKKSVKKPNLLLRKKKTKTPFKKKKLKLIQKRPD